MQNKTHSIWICFFFHSLTSTHRVQHLRSPITSDGCLSARHSCCKTKIVFFFIKSCANAAFNNIVKMLMHIYRVSHECRIRLHVVGWRCIKFFYSFSIAISCHPIHSFFCLIRSFCHWILSYSFGHCWAKWSFWFAHTMELCVKRAHSRANKWRRVDDDNARRNKRLAIYVLVVESTNNNCNVCLISAIFMRMGFIEYVCSLVYK